MKLAVLSDIHGNWPGLMAVAEHIERWQPDHIIVDGDVVNRGPNSAICWDFVQRKRRDAGWQVVLGNHEEYVIAQGKPEAIRAGIPFDIYRPSYWVYEQLGCNVSALEALPFALEETLEETAVRVTHASMHGTRDGVYRFTTDAELMSKIGLPAPALFVVGHTHQPLIRRVNGTLVVNAGATGMPFDNDWRVSYAQLTHTQGAWQAEIVRLEYDRAQAERDFTQTGFIDGGGPITRIMLRELQLSTGLLYTFFKLYERPVLDGEYSLKQAVELFLASH